MQSKNVVYEVVCNLYNASYEGETFRTYRTRILEHVNTTSSSVYAHLLGHHVLPSRNHITHKLRASSFGDSLQRKACETQIISMENPQINIHFNRA